MMLTGGLRHDEECDSNAVGQGEIMTGLFLIAVVVVWAWIAVFIARALTIRVKRALVRRLGATILALVLLPLPVADELIAAPQFRTLCEDGTKVKFDPLTIRGKTIFSNVNPTPDPRITVGTLHGYYVPWRYYDAATKELVISYRTYYIKGGLLIRLLGISEKQAPLTFEGSCAPVEHDKWLQFLKINQLSEIDLRKKNEH